ncbi:MAG: hypothetical protein A2386_08615 [Elusimicrobia bacterium RIFOXYB1_FULL_48_9]|nr:MAG: hypothetical protein A2386_08615 [Elusimicrobia bacterium RIFOXYB1_FULL_48_9]
MIIPTFMGSYRGTKEVTDLIGGGTLFQDGQNHLGSLKLMYSPISQLKLKIGSSYRLELLRETTDETWGKGLFDYKKLNNGVEAEYAYLKNQSVRVGYDIYTITFPNYESLESSVSASGLGRELAGKTVLDSSNRMMSARFSNKIADLRTEVGYTQTGKSYADQPLVLADSSLSTVKREDSYSNIFVGLSYPIKAADFMKILVSFDGALVSNDSNQGHYDASKLKFTPDYYDYSYRSLNPALNFALGSLPWVLGVNYGMNRQEYKERLVQDVDGNYEAGKIYVDETVYGLNIIYPLTREFKLRLVSTYIQSKSNMKYEKTYSYNYTTSNYLMGFSYEF